MQGFERDDNKRILEFLGEKLSWDIVKMVSWLNTRHKDIGVPINWIANGRSDAVLALLKKENKEVARIYQEARAFTEAHSSASINDFL